MKKPFLRLLLPTLLLVAAGACSTNSGTTEQGAIACGDGRLVCNGQCVSAASNPVHCGECGHSCPGGTVCSSGLCQDSCEPGLSQCDSSCIDPLSDGEHCGMCDSPCEYGLSCVSSQCICDNPMGCAPPQGGTGGAPLGTGGGPSGVGANFTVNASVSAVIGTVGIVTFSVDKPITSAVIEFGRTPGVAEYAAPVDLAAPGYRTLLLGMKQGTPYSIRVVAQGAEGTYSSEAVTLQTSYLPNALPALSLTTNNPVGLYGGFTVACNGVGSARPGEETAASYAFIFDRDGDYVWAYDLSATPARECVRARMSHDGKHLWAGSFANTTSPTKGALRRISMDGLEVMDYTENPPGPTNTQVANISRRHHDFTILGNGNVLYQERKTIDDDMSPDTMRELDVNTGLSTLLFDTEPTFGYVGTHMNYVTWIPSLNAISGSMRHINTIILVGYPSGQLMGVFSGDHDQFGVTWEAQHGHQFAGGQLLVFNNKNAGNADILEFPFNLQSKVAGPLATFPSSYSSLAFGDVRRLPNGNTFITYSNAGHMLEIDPSKTVLRDISTAPLGYTEHRSSLYGPPPHFAD